MFWQELGKRVTEPRKTATGGQGVEASGPPK
jgi:hypothetical protein